jgi:hypothetical protein
MWAWMKYLAIAMRLSMFLGNLQAVRANDPTTTAASYQPAADMILTSGDGQAFLARLTTEQKAAVAAGLPLAIWLIDHLTE